MPLSLFFFFFFFFMIRRPPRSTPLSLHDALPISFYITPLLTAIAWSWLGSPKSGLVNLLAQRVLRSEEHTSELQSQSNLVCRLLLEKKKKNKTSKEIQTINSHNHNTRLHTAHNRS